jgi:cation transporter-like permease
MRWRTPLGGLAILVGLAAYAVGAATLGGALPDHILIQSVYYLVAGLLWIVPAVAIMGWARRDDGPDG